MVSTTDDGDCSCCDSGGGIADVATDAPVCESWYTSSDINIYYSVLRMYQIHVVGGRNIDFFT